MKYFYENVSLCADKSLLTKINSSAKMLHEKLIGLDLKKIGISEYNQRYLGNKLRNPVGTLQLYSYLLSLSVKNNKLPLDKFTFVDYGGGSGILSLLAKELGIGQVIYNDIYHVSCNDIQIIAQQTGIDIDQYVCGDIDDLIEHLRENSVSINTIASYDVIEHIYDIERYLIKLRLLSKNEFRFVFGSGANTNNPIINRKLSKAHFSFEFSERQRVWGHKERDTLNGYLDARREIISSYDISMPVEVVDKIAKKTRGLIREDIIACVDEYNKTGEISYEPNHPTNTCDPYTGNWAEHLMKTDYLKNILLKEGAEVEIMKGYCSSARQIYKNVVFRILNLIISCLGEKGIVVAPYFIVFGKFNDAQSGSRGFSLPSSHTT